MNGGGNNVLIETAECRCIALHTGDGEDTTYRVENVEPPTHGDRYDDQRVAEVATWLRTRCPDVATTSWSRGGPRPPISVAVEGPVALAGWLYLRHQTTRYGGDGSPYQHIAEHLDVREQTARNYITRLLAGE